jgi:hypothetical protein
VESIRSKVDKDFVGFLFSFAIDSDASVSVMVIKVVTESPSANLKAQVTVAHGSGGRTGE